MIAAKPVMKHTTPMSSYNMMCMVEVISQNETIAQSETKNCGQK